MRGNIAEKLRNQVWGGYNVWGPFHIENMEMTHSDNEIIIKYTSGFSSSYAARIEVRAMINRINRIHSCSEVKQ